MTFPITKETNTSMHLRARAIHILVKTALLNCAALILCSVFHFKHDIQIVHTQERRHVSNSQPNDSSGV